MKGEPRIYDGMLAGHLASLRQMAFVSGPRQVGKTTVCRNASAVYMSWDLPEDQRRILKGPAEVASYLELDRVRAERLVVVFDELHKHSKWKQFLKGFFDAYEGKVRVLVTGSSRLDIYRRGGDSLMGRYFLYRMHPFTVGELVDPTVPSSPCRAPRPLDEARWLALLRHGGFPEPFLRRADTFTRRWRTLRLRQLTREDLRQVAALQDLGAMEVMTMVLAERSSQQLVYASLAQEVNVSGETAKRWVTLLESMHYGFLVRPWFRSVSNSLRKEPKWFLRDWSGIDDPGAKAETVIACHLLKSVEGWTDLGLGEFELRYIRTKQRQEVDFLVVRDGKPWLLVEAKQGECRLSPTLASFQEKLKVPHALQVVMDLPYEQVDCFRQKGAVVVPARTFLSQLM